MRGGVGNTERRRIKQSALTLYKLPEGNKTKEVVVLEDARDTNN